MIGQGQLQSRIEHLVENRTFPRFSIFVGPGGSGKRTFASWIVSELASQTGLSYSYVCPDVKIETIRGIIHGAYTTFGGISIYIIPDADSMSNAAKNALLKVTEEPPNNCYFIMTLEDENNTLETIRSRATVFHMDRYTPDDIRRYCRTGETLWPSEIEEIVVSLADTPGDVNILSKWNVQEFYDYVQLVVENIAEVSLANAFKIPSKVALKEDAEGYDLRLFWKAFMKVCTDKYKSEEYLPKQYGYLESALSTSKYLQKLRIKGINKQMLMDNWILEIRELWK